MTEILENEIIEEIEQPIEEIIEIPQRANPFCVIRKEKWSAYPHHDIQKNSSWSENPYPEEYAVVPDDMVAEISETRGFCDIELNEDGTEIIGFTAREIPEIPTPPKEKTAEERIAELEAQNAELQANLEMQAEVLDFLLMA